MSETDDTTAWLGWERVLAWYHDFPAETLILKVEDGHFRARGNPRRDFEIVVYSDEPPEDMPHLAARVAIYSENNQVDVGWYLLPEQAMRLAKLLESAATEADQWNRRR